MRGGRSRLASGLVALAAAALLLVRAGGDGAGAARAEVLGAVRFGALFAVHGAPADARAGARCGPVREHYGIQVLAGGRAESLATSQWCML